MADTMTRPRPPEELGQFIGAYPVQVAPAHDMPLWVTKTFLTEKSKLFNSDHDHLIDAMDYQIGFLWVSGSYIKAGRQILGQTEEVAFRCNVWQKARLEQQMREWFGFTYPDYLISLDADYCRVCSDINFCALVEHELYHISQELDKFGDPKFKKDTGLPSLTIKGHDVEEFCGVVRRYGANSEVQRLIDAAKQKPEVANIDIAHACGNCLKAVA